MVRIFSEVNPKIIYLYWNENVCLTLGSNLIDIRFLLIFILRYIVHVEKITYSLFNQV